MTEEKGKRLLILGCGYLGRLLARQAVESGVKVKAVSRNLDTLEEVKRLGVETFCGMVDETAWHSFAGSDVDWVVNCVSSAGNGLDGYRQSYVGGNFSLGKWMESVAFAGRAVFTSSVSVYGDEGGSWVDDAKPCQPNDERGEILLEAEQVFYDALQTASGTVLRLGGLYGPGRHLMLDRLRSAPSELPGSGDYHLNLVRIEDVAGAVWSVLKHGVSAPGPFAVVDDRPTLKSEIVAWIAEQLGHAVPRFTGITDPNARGSRRLGRKGKAADRKISNERLKDAVEWSPRFVDFRAGFADLMALDRS